MKKGSACKYIKSICLDLSLCIIMWQLRLWFWDNNSKIRWSWIKTSRTKEINDQSYPRKTHKIVATSFALAAHNSQEVLAKESEYFSYKGEDYAGVFPEKKEKLCTILQMLLNKKEFWRRRTG